MIKWTVVALTALVLAIGTTVAGEIEDLARQAEAKAGAGQHTEAVEILRRALTLLTARGPLTLRRVQFITAPPKGFGIYQPRANNVFQRGEPLIIYVEPVGMGWRSADKIHRANMITDFEIRTADGKVLGGQKDFGRFEFASHEQNQEVMTHLTITLSGAPRGQYLIAATYRDQVTGNSASLELPFEIK